MVEEEKEPQKVKDRILELLEKRYTRSQLINDFGFATRTVDAAISEYKESHGGEVPAEHSPAASGGKFEVIKMDSKQIVPPEQALQGIRLQDGEYKLGFQDGMGVLLMAARYNQILAASQSEILTNQIKIMEESRKGSTEMAQEAAARAAAGVGAEIMPRIDQLASQMAAGSQNPMASLMVSMMAPAFQQAGQQVAKLFGATQPGAQPQAGEQQGNVQQSQQPWSQTNIEFHSRQELED